MSNSRSTTVEHHTNSQQQQSQPDNDQQDDRQQQQSSSSPQPSSSSSSSNNHRTNLIVNYLPQSMSDEQFRVMFAKHGDLRSARIIRNKTSGYSYGFGFVEYFQPDDAQQAINSLNGLLINNKRIKVALARPSSDNIKNANIYVTNLPSDYGEREVRTMFARCGDIIQCRLLGNRAGTAFILFNLHEEAQRAIEYFNRKLVPGTNCRMKVKFAINEVNKRILKDGPSSNQQNNGNNINVMVKKRMFHNNYDNNHSNMQFHNGDDEPMDYGVMNEKNRYMDSSNFVSRSSMSSGPIRGHGHSISSRFNPLSQQSGLGFHDSSSLSSDHQHAAMYSDNRFNIHPNDNNHFMLPANNFDMGHGSASASATISNNQNEFILFVYNIGPEANEFNLMKLFSNYGQVIRSNVIRKGGSGEGRGYGFVAMKYYDDAMNAIKYLNGFKFFYNKPLQVRFAEATNNAPFDFK